MNVVKLPTRPKLSSIERISSFCSFPKLYPDAQLKWMNLPQNYWCKIQLHFIKLQIDLCICLFCYLCSCFILQPELVSLYDCGDTRRTCAGQIHQVKQKKPKEAPTKKEKTHSKADKTEKQKSRKQKKQRSRAKARNQESKNNTEEKKKPPWSINRLIATRLPLKAGFERNSQTSKIAPQCCLKTNLKI